MYGGGDGGGGAGKEVVSKPESLHPVACLHLLSKGAAGRQAYLSGCGFFISGNRWQAAARQLFFHCPLISNRERRERERERPQVEVVHMTNFLK